MGGMCWAYGCKHYNVRETCHFYRFPKDPKERRKWIKALRRVNEPGKGAVVCSCHFVDGKKENGPTLFIFNEKKKFPHYLSPEKKKQRKLTGRTENQDEGENRSLHSEQPSTSKEIPQFDIDQPSTSGAQGSLHSTFTDVDITQPSTSKQESDPLLLSPTALEAELYFLRKDIKEKNEQLKNVNRLSYTHIKDNDKLIVLYTGLPNSTIFEALYELIKEVEIDYYLKWRVENISKISSC